VISDFELRNADLVWTRMNANESGWWHDFEFRNADFGFGSDADERERERMVA